MKKYPKRILSKIPRNTRRKLASKNGLTVDRDGLLALGLTSNEFVIFAVNRQTGMFKIRFSALLGGPRV